MDIKYSHMDLHNKVPGTCCMRQTVKYTANKRCRGRWREGILPVFCFYLSLAALHNNQFLLRRGSGENDLSVVLQDVVELLGAQVFQVSAVDDAGLGISEKEDRRRRKITQIIGCG